MSSPLAAVFATGLFAMAVWTTRHVWVGSMPAALSLPGLVNAAKGDISAIVSAAGAAMLVVFGHRSTFVRLQDGSEYRLG